MGNYQRLKDGYQTQKENVNVTKLTFFLNDDMIITGVLKHLGFNRCHGHARWQKEPITNRLGISTASCHARSAGQCNRQYPAIPAMGETIRARDL